MKTIKILLLTLTLLVAPLSKSYCWIICTASQDINGNWEYTFYEGDGPCYSGSSTCPKDVGCDNCPDGCLCIYDADHNAYQQRCWDNAIVHQKQSGGGIGTGGVGPINPGFGGAALWTNTYPSNIISPHGQIIQATKVISGVLHFATVSGDGYHVYDETPTSITQVHDYSTETLIYEHYCIKSYFDEYNNVSSTLYDISDGSIPLEAGISGVQCHN